LASASALRPLVPVDNPDQRERWRSLVALVLVLVALSPVLAVVATRTGRDFLPIQDIAVIDLRVRDVFSGDAPLVGPYSRYGWNHPGPTMYLVPAVLGAPFGHPAWATLVGGALIQGLAIGWMAALAWRLGRLPLLALTLGGLSLAYSAMGEWIFLEAWNPHLAFPFFALFLLQVWAIGEGRIANVLGATITASVLTQMHVGYLPFVATGAAYAVGCLFAQRESVDRRTLGRVAALSAAAAIVLWLPAMIDQVVSEPGNLRALASFFVQGESPPPIGLQAGAELLAVEFRPPLPWLGGSDPVDATFGWASGAPIAWLLVPLVLLAGSALLAWRTGSRPLARLVTLVTIMTLTAVGALSRVTDLPDRYLFLWRVEIAILIVLVTAVAVFTALNDHWKRRAGVVGIVCLTAATVWGFGGLALDVVRHPSAVMAEQPRAQAIIDQLDIPSRPVIVRFAGDPFRGIQGAVVDELDRRGAPVYVDRELDYQFGDHRVLDTSKADRVWYVVEQGQFATLLEDLPAAEILAELTPLSPADEAELRSLERRIIRALRSAGREELLGALDKPLAELVLAEVPGLEPELVERAVALIDKAQGGCRCAVIAFPADLAPTETFGALSTDIESRGRDPGGARIEFAQRPAAEDGS